MCRLLLVWAWTGVDCSWEMPGPGWVDPPPSPALRRSWGKVLVCHKGLGGVFCVSGPDVCQPKALGWSTSWRIFGCNWPLSHSWLDCPQGCCESLFGPPWSNLFPLFSRVVPHLVCVLFPHPIHLPPSCSPLSPVLFFVPHTF